MRILYLTEYFQTPSEGGLMRTWELCRFLAEKGHQVTVVVPAVHHMTGEMPSGFQGFAQRSEVAGIRVVKVWTTTGFREGYLKRLLFYFSTPLSMAAVAWREPADLLFTSSPPFFLGPLAWLQARLRRIPWVTEVRDTWLEIAVAKRLVPRSLRDLLRAFERWCFRHADRLVAVTPGVRRMILDRLGTTDEDRVLLVMNGYEEDVFAATDPALAPRLAERHDLAGKFVVIYAGTLGLALDGMTLARAAGELRDLPDVRFVFIGEGEGRAAMQSYAEAEGISDRMLFVPLQPRRDIPAWLSLAAVGINSIRAGEAMESSLSNKIFDYMGAGLPVVYCGGGDTRDFLERSRGGIAVDPGDARAMAETIRRWHADPGERCRVGRTGQAFVLEHQTRRRLAAPLEAMFRELGR